MLDYVMLWEALTTLVIGEGQALISIRACGAHSYSTSRSWNYRKAATTPSQQQQHCHSVEGFVAPM